MAKKNMIYKSDVKQSIKQAKRKLARFNSLSVQTDLVKSRIVNESNRITKLENQLQHT